MPRDRKRGALHWLRALHLTGKRTADKRLDFVVIGAQKSGTTSLHQYLDQHPDIFMSKPMKEPRYFLPFDETQRYYLEATQLRLTSKEELYREHMLRNYRGERLFGESSTDYTFFDRARQYRIPEVIHEYNPRMKLVYILRNPLARLRSNYLHDSREGREHGITFSDYLLKGGRQHVLTSLYGYQRAAYTPLFPAKRFKLLIFEDLVRDPNAVVQEVFEFLGVEPLRRADFRRAYNVSTNRDEFDPEDLKLSSEVYEELHARIRKDVDTIGTALGRDLWKTWDLSPERWCRKHAFVQGGRRLQGEDQAPTAPDRRSVVVVANNAASILERSMARVRGHGKSDVELVVVDQGSTDGTLDLLAELDAQIDCYVSMPQLGFARAVDLGIALARSEQVTLWKAGEETPRFERLLTALHPSTRDDEDKRLTPEAQTRQLADASKRLRRIFPYLTEEEVDTLVRSRFDLSLIEPLLAICERYAHREQRFAEALRCALEVRLRYGEGFVFKGAEIDQYLAHYVALAERLDVPLSAFRVEEPGARVGEYLAQIDAMQESLRQADDGGGESVRILHFASLFSSPSETFIYDLIQRLEAEPWSRNVVLCDERLLASERPFDRCFAIDWDRMHESVRELVYRHLFRALAPDVCIGHFALNGWKLHERLQPLGIRIPTVQMTHGIDVALISSEPDYREYILKHAAVDPSTRFTAVSRYLSNELHRRGVPESRITLIPNVIHPRFFSNRKVDNYYDGSRDLQVLSVGRLIGWKGHRELFEGVKYFVDHVSTRIRLTLVYGKGDDELPRLELQARLLGIRDRVDFVEFVNFDEDPGFYARFDLFVSASKYSEGPTRRSETFGMSTLEAIAAGLPVIVTDAGGTPEVVGVEGRHVRIVPHGDGLAIGKALEAVVRDGGAFSDNEEYARARLDLFSPARQTSQLKAVVEEVCARRPRVSLLTSEITGGAGAAASRVHLSLLKNGLDSELVTRDNTSARPPGPRYRFLSAEIGQGWDELYSSRHIKPDYTVFSLNEPQLHNATLERLCAQADVINIHWFARFLSVENIGYLSNLGKPLVITVRDMNPLTGGCHYFHDCDRWRADCYGCPQLVGDIDHFPAQVLAAKKRLWNMDNITLVALSDHTAAILARSSLFAGCEVRVIGNPIDIGVFRARPDARQRLHLRPEPKRALFISSFQSKVKGRAELQLALAALKRRHPEFKLQLMAAGANTASFTEKDFSYPVFDLGRIEGADRLADVYSAVDVTVIPSLEETFSNTAAESVACGTPIVGFQTGAIRDIAGDGQRGQSVPVGDTDQLAEALYETLQRERPARECRDYAERHFTFEGQGALYASLFEELTQRDHKLRAMYIEDVDPSLATGLVSWYSRTRAGMVGGHDVEEIVRSKAFRLARTVGGSYREFKRLLDTFRLNTRG